MASRLKQEHHDMLPPFIMLQEAVIKVPQRASRRPYRRLPGHLAAHTHTHIHACANASTVVRVAHLLKRQLQFRTVIVYFGIG